MSLLKGSKIEVSDPTDWDSTELPAISSLDSMLRCHICKDYLKAPVLTSCGHMFCSMCIRKALDVNSRCPLCQEEIFEGSLRKVLLLDGIIHWFKKQRSILFDKLKKPEKVDDSQNDPASDEIIDLTIPDDDDNHIPNRQGHLDVGPSHQDSDKLVECPICFKFMTIDELQTTHLDECLKTKSVHSKRKSDSGISVLLSPHKKKQKVQSFQIRDKKFDNVQRLPNFDSTMSTTKLREKLVSYNLPTGGPRARMEARLREYINIYNSNLDSLYPKDKRILLDQLSKWESLMDLKNKESKPRIEDEKSQVIISKAKKDSKNWRIKYKSQYDTLIKRAKANIETKKKEE